MDKPKESFIVNRLKSVKYAFLGMWRLIQTEASIQIQLFIAIIVTIAGFYYSISNTEWIMQCFAILEHRVNLTETLLWGKLKCLLEVDGPCLVTMGCLLN